MPATIASFTVHENPTGGPHTVEYPASIQLDDLLIAVCAFDNSPNPAFPAGWVDLIYRDAASACVLIIKYKVALGTESGTFTLTAGGSDESTCWMGRIIDWDTALLPTATVDWEDVTPNADVDPPSHTVSPAQDFWLAVAQADGTNAWTATPWPTAYTDNRVKYNVWAALALATRIIDPAVTTENPGIFTHSAPKFWVAATVALSSKQEFVPQIYRRVRGR